MKEVARERNGIAHQTDSIEGWFKEDDDCENNLTATISSRHSDVVGKHVATMMTISFGRTSAHYKKHFRALILSMGYKSFQDFVDNFDGNIR